MNICYLMKQKLQSFVLQAECRLWEKRWVQLMFMFSSSGSADGVGRRLHSAPGLGLSKTPTAEMEHSLHEANAVSASQAAPCQGPSRECGEDDQYGAENFRRISRSLSGTVVSEREEVPVSSHSFVSRIRVCLFRASSFSC